MKSTVGFQRGKTCLNLATEDWMTGFRLLGVFEKYSSLNRKGLRFNNRCSWRFSNG